MSLVESSALRGRLARALSGMYGEEVPAYRTLVQACDHVNGEAASGATGDKSRYGSRERVSAERHGAIRLGTPRELAQAGQIFAAYGMHPVGFYDLRGAGAGVPVISTAFRPLSPADLARNPFRVFTSLLAVPDRNYFTAEFAARIDSALHDRQIFAPRLLLLAERAEAENGLPDAEAAELLGLTVDAFRLSAEPLDRSWYAELGKVSAVAADIAGSRGTHINHLAPRVLDIDRLFEHMRGLGVAMIDDIQGPPRWDGPDVLLRQTSFRALAEPRRFREADGSMTSGSLNVRFGEVEARGMALTPEGRESYDEAMAEVDSICQQDPTAGRRETLSRVWTLRFPTDETDYFTEGLAAFTVTPAAATRRASSGDVGHLVRTGELVASPIVYEDFLPRSAAGIFRSNLEDATGTEATARAADLDADWLEGALDRALRFPDALYAAQQQTSVATALRALGIPEQEEPR